MTWASGCYKFCESRKFRLSEYSNSLMTWASGWYNFWIFRLSKSLEYLTICTSGCTYTLSAPYWRSIRKFRFSESWNFYWTELQAEKPDIQIFRISDNLNFRLLEIMNFVKARSSGHCFLNPLKKLHIKWRGNSKEQSHMVFNFQQKHWKTSHRQTHRHTSHM